MTYSSKGVLAMWVGDWTWTVHLRSCHNISMGFKSRFWLGYLQIWGFFFFWAITRLRSVLGHRLMTRHSLCCRQQNLWSINYGMSSKQQSIHTLTRPLPSLTVNMMCCVNFTTDVMRPMSSENPNVDSTKYNPKRLGEDGGVVMCLMWDRFLCSSWFEYHFSSKLI